MGLFKYETNNMNKYSSEQNPFVTTSAITNKEKSRGATDQRRNYCPYGSLSFVLWSLLIAQLTYLINTAVRLKHLLNTRKVASLIMIHKQSKHPNEKTPYS